MNQMSKIIICDPTLRDGNHAIKHQLTLENIRTYCQFIDQAGVDVVEVGHGNGLGASSLQLGKTPYSDREMLRAAREMLKTTKLGIHIIPGFGTIHRNLSVAIEEGVDVVRVASHCTEADTTERHIKFSKLNGCMTFGVLMMSHMASKRILLEEAKKMRDYGAEAVILMDSAGAYLPKDVKERISFIVEKITIPVGFHAHNNLGLAIANSIAAIDSGAKILDGTAAGFGAGAGNAQLEVMVAILKKLNYEINVNLNKLLDAVEAARKDFITSVPFISKLSLISAINGVFSGFAGPVQKVADEFKVDPCEIFRILGLQKIIAGQEDLIIEVAKKLKENELIES